MNELEQQFIKELRDEFKPVVKAHTPYTDVEGNRYAKNQHNTCSIMTHMRLAAHDSPAKVDQYVDMKSRMHRAKKTGSLRDIKN